jgi:hypothetical protein
MVGDKAEVLLRLLADGRVFLSLYAGLYYRLPCPTCDSPFDEKCMEAAEMPGLLQQAHVEQ